MTLVSKNTFHPPSTKPIAFESRKYNEKLLTLPFRWLQLHIIFAWTAEKELEEIASYCTHYFMVHLVFITSVNLVHKW